MPAPRSISVLMPVYQGERFLARVLEALAGQRIGAPWDFTAVDCGSTDETLAIFERFARDFPVPLRVHRIEREEFDHGDTRNLLAGLSSGEILVYLTDDAIPASSGWLATLVLNFDDPTVGGAYGRHVPRPGADPLAKALALRDPNYAEGRREVRLPPPAELEELDPHERRILFNYCDTASAMRRVLWERHPYPRCRGAEDLLQARALLYAGYTVVFDDRAVVQHCHEYGVEETLARARVDGESNAEWFGRLCIGAEEDVEVEVREQLRHDRRALEVAGLRGEELARELRRAEQLRSARFRGFYEGGRSWKRRPPTRMREESRFSALFVVDGEPEVDETRDACYAAGLARRLQRKGHRCALLTGEALREDPGTEVTLEREERGGLAVYRLTAGLRDEAESSSRFESMKRALDEVLTRERVELIHHFDPPAPGSLFLRRSDHPELPVVLSALDPGDRAERGALDGWAERLRICDLLVCPDRPLHDRLLEIAGPDRDRLVDSPDSHRADGGFQEDLVRWEYRYRALLCVDWREAALLDLPAARTAAREGRILEQGRDTLYLEGPGAAVEYELQAGLGGEWEVAVQVPTFPVESKLLFEGRVRVDGDELAALGPFTGGGLDEVRELVVGVRLPARVRRLRVENVRTSGGTWSALRLRRIEVRRHGRRAHTPFAVRLDRTGRESRAARGRVTPQGADAVLLGPGRAAVEYDLSNVGAGAREIELHVAVDAAEELLLLGGRIEVDGLLLGRFGPFHSRGRDETRVLRVSTLFDGAPRRLVIENVMRDDRPPVHLRVKRVVVRNATGRPHPLAAVRDRWTTRLRTWLGRPAKLRGGEPS